MRGFRIHPPNWGIRSNRSAGRLTGRFFKSTEAGRNSMGSCTGGRHEFFHIRTATFGTIWRRISGRQQECFKTVAAAFTLIFIYRHWFLRKIMFYIIDLIALKSSIMKMLIFFPGSPYRQLEYHSKSNHDNAEESKPAYRLQGFGIWDIAL